MFAGQLFVFCNVESFKIIRDAQAKKLGKRSLSFDEKKLILQKQLWGVDVDSDALQISAFSLYLALLEDESAKFIQEKIVYLKLKTGK